MLVSILIVRLMLSDRKKIWCAIIGGIITVLMGCRSSTGYPYSFALEFPENIDLGELWLVEDPNCFTCGSSEEYVGRAMGEHHIRLPAAHWFLSLRMPRTASGLMPHLSHSPLSSLGDISLSNSDITDEDLEFISGANLRSIDLSGTRIIGSGLKHLKPHRKWIFVNLDDCVRLDPKYLAHFRGWKRATIRLVDYKGEGETYSENEKRLLSVARELICDGQPESICHTQIR